MRTDECRRGDAPAHAFFAATVQRSSTTAAISTRASCSMRAAGMPCWKPPARFWDLSRRAQARSYSVTREKRTPRPLQLQASAPPMQITSKKSELVSVRRASSARGGSVRTAEL